MIRRPPRSTLSSSSAASDVYKRQGKRGHPLDSLSQGRASGPNRPKGRGTTARPKAQNHSSNSQINGSKNSLAQNRTRARRVVEGSHTNWTIAWPVGSIDYYETCSQLTFDLVLSFTMTRGQTIVTTQKSRLLGLVFFVGHFRFTNLDPLQLTSIHFNLLQLS